MRLVLISVFLVPNFFIPCALPFPQLQYGRGVQRLWPAALRRNLQPLRPAEDTVSDSVFRRL